MKADLPNLVLALDYASSFYELLTSRPKGKWSTSETRLGWCMFGWLWRLVGSLSAIGCAMNVDSKKMAVVRVASNPFARALVQALGKIEQCVTGARQHIMLVNTGDTQLSHEVPATVVAQLRKQREAKLSAFYDQRASSSSASSGKSASSILERKEKAIDHNNKQWMPSQMQGATPIR